MRELGEHPGDPVATLYQVDDHEAGESQPDVGVDGVPNVEELQCAQ